MLIAQLSPCGQNASEPPASTISWQIVAGALARRPDDLLVELAGNSAEGSPADLDRPEPLRAVKGGALLHQLRHLHQDRGIGFDPVR